MSLIRGPYFEGGFEPCDHTGISFAKVINSSGSGTDRVKIWVQFKQSQMSFHAAELQLVGCTLDLGKEVSYFGKSGCCRS